MFLILKFITLIFCSFFLIFSVLKILKGKLNSLYICYSGFYLFFVSPLFLDLFFGLPNYYYHNFYVFYGFIVSNGDSYTNYLYLLIVILTTILLFLFGKKDEFKLTDLKTGNIGIYKIPITIALIVIIVIPFIAAVGRTIMMGQSLVNLLDYEYLRVLFRLDTNFLIYYYLCLFSVLGFILLIILHSNRVHYLLLVFIIPLFASFGIYGKRYIVAIFFFLFLFALIFNKNIKAKYKKYFILLGFVIIIGFSIFYQNEVRGISSTEGSFDKFYTNFRIDFGRDDVTKLAIFYDLYGPELITDDGTTHLYLLKYLFPQLTSFYTEETYSVYVTSRLLGNMDTIDYGWGMTTSLLDESISNYGLFFGTFLNAFILIFICRIADKTRSLPVLLFSFIVLFLIQVLELVAFVFIFFVWILLLVAFYFKKIRY